MWDNVALDVLLWGSVLAGVGWWAHRREQTRLARATAPCACQPSHVRLAGVERRCVKCNKVKPTMLHAEAWGEPELPFCGGCLRAVASEPGLVGEVVA